jgi:hypothetical protein
MSMNRTTLELGSGFSEKKVGLFMAIAPLLDSTHADEFYALFLAACSGELKEEITQSKFDSLGINKERFHQAVIRINALKDEICTTAKK